MTKQSCVFSKYQLWTVKIVAIPAAMYYKQQKMTFVATPTTPCGCYNPITKCVYVNNGKRQRRLDGTNALAHVTQNNTGEGNFCKRGVGRIVVTVPINWPKHEVMRNQKTLSPLTSSGVNTFVRRRKRCLLFSLQRGSSNNQYFS